MARKANTIPMDRFFNYCLHSCLRDRDRRGYSTKNPEKRMNSFQSETKKKSILREFLLLDIKRSAKLLSADVEARISSKFDCKSIIIAQVAAFELKGYYYYRIGFHTKNSSKHTYSKVTRALFPEIAGEDFVSQAKKGIGSWSRSLCDKNFEIILCSGELQTDALLEIAKNANKKLRINPTTTTSQSKGKASHQHKKAQRLSPGPETQKEKRSKSPKKYGWLRTFFKKTFGLVERCLYAMLEQIVRVLIKGFLGILLYIQFFKVLQIDKIDPTILTNMTWWERFNFLLGDQPPSQNWTPFCVLLGLTALYYKIVQMLS